MFVLYHKIITMSTLFVIFNVCPDFFVRLTEEGTVAVSDEVELRLAGGEAESSGYTSDVFFYSVLSVASDFYRSIENIVDVNCFHR